ncbi:MAG: SMC-Scp complex subunit ScpB [Omnitrophica bacterium RIFCSPLOWO2_12_FULL_44_17]|uniref:SMC-Scp complex subunit ScpB n=1 Tax=Candidatus Danuiimicrobium aquiferis TaxID=1801832 RepID=A0A1G1L1I7_9BACT|nr:MAG: SMC-Scp complex subunit ScpB [Omnitrophica bacterium RIFCSPHIGHO2_02_FULL_45_28]OGW89956.1 MAG: SMC-Scp complex subunit ScpB [Omnitrophica bacterium RIFCSPHIGHO2_12_FULL_44_12]OGW99006.1 MAG: SMC-Scp complex subunit ScpB [Omnitrophica bacterium RIFCSPLOWO2_12_FULL_44_17]OGX04185.1 MAG: SMC-Scp complex subunit ScpB [Omnitrophica bacterium RIFCSPLOWO2_02_FULL_44_11]
MSDKEIQGMKEKEREAALKALREEISREIEDMLPDELRDSVRKPTQTESFTSLMDGSIMPKRIIEAILFTASRPVTISDFKRVLPELRATEIESLVRELQTEYEAQGSSFRIQEIAGGFECATEPKYAPWIMKLELQRRSKHATQSALETLSILAYKQPVTRAEIEELRGVDVSGVMSTLMERDLIKIVGRKEVPGRPFLYGTTQKFLEHFGLKSLKDLPDISEIRTLVENSIKRDELLKKEQIIQVENAASETSDVKPEDTTPGGGAVQPEEQTPAPESEMVTDEAKNVGVSVESIHEKVEQLISEEEALGEELPSKISDADFGNCQ